MRRLPTAGKAVPTSEESAMPERSAALSPFGVKTAGPTADDLPPEAQAFLLREGFERVYQHGESVLRHLEVPSTAAWLLEGRLRSVVFHADGSEQYGGWVMQGELFGVGNLFMPGSPARVSLLVETDQARILHFSRELLLQMMDTWAEARIGVAIGLSRRVMQLFDVIHISGPRSLQDQLRAALVWMAKHYGVPARDGSVELWVAQNELAGAVGASRQRVHLELRYLQEQGDVDLAYRKVVVRPQFFEKIARETR